MKITVNLDRLTAEQLDTLERMTRDENASVTDYVMACLTADLEAQRWILTGGNAISYQRVKNAVNAGYDRQTTLPI